MGILRNKKGFMRGFWRKAKPKLKKIKIELIGKKIF